MKRKGRALSLLLATETIGQNGIELSQADLHTDSGSAESLERLQSPFVDDYVAVKPSDFASQSRYTFETAPCVPARSDCDSHTRRLSVDVTKKDLIGTAGQVVLQPGLEQESIAVDPLVRSSEKSCVIQKSWQGTLKLKSKFGISPGKKDNTIPRSKRRQGKGSDVNDLRKAVAKIPGKAMSPASHQPAAPAFTLPLIAQSCHVGTTATLSCQVCGRPRPTVTWWGPQGEPLALSQRVATWERDDGMAFLEIRASGPQDNGIYTCEAVNDVGSAACRAQLRIISRPGPPSPPVICERRPRSITLQWDPPQSTGNTENITYNVDFAQINHNTIRWETSCAHILHTTHKVDNLLPGATYKFRITAQNDVGSSEGSETTTPITLPDDTALARRDSNLYWQHTWSTDFNITRELGRGRYSSTHTCTRSQQQRALAAKFISKRLMNFEQVQHEAAILKPLQHPFIYQLHATYETHGQYILVLDLVPDGRLLEYLVGLPQVTERQVISFIRQLVQAIGYLHSNGIVHLDIKPENTLVDMTSGQPQLKLVDFGDAMDLWSSPPPHFHELNANPEFAAPELLHGAEIDYGTDMWSVGAMAYVLLSGISPFLDESVEETNMNIMRVDYSFPDEFFKGVSMNAKHFISGLLKVLPSDRTSTSECLLNHWLVQTYSSQNDSLLTHRARLADFIHRRKTQHIFVTVKIKR
ncbi:kalirin-like [Diadema antillarum]|uniref:kalirin-like n=3 Tax=Diadema antillarum TaxID=105358 RepID=UPI003A838E94